VSSEGAPKTSEEAEGLILTLTLIQKLRAKITEDIVKQK